MATITQNVYDVAGDADDSAWIFYTELIREGSDGASIITHKRVRCHPEDGVITQELDPGPAIVSFGGKNYPFVVPETDSELWPLIQAAAELPETTKLEQIQDAIDHWFELNIDTEIGAALVTADTAEAARAVIDSPPSNGVVYAFNEGITADAVTDISSALGTLLNTVPDGSTLQLQAGTYYAPTLRNLAYDNNIVIRGVQGRTKILGDGSITAGSIDSDVMLNLTGGSIRIEDVEFEDTGVVFGAEDLLELGDISLIGCSFTGCAGIWYVKNGVASFVAGVAAARESAFGHFKMIGCNVTNCELGVKMDFRGGWDSFIVADCTFDDIGRVGVWIGQEGTGSSYPVTYDRTIHQPRQARVIVHDNVFRNVRQSGYTLGGDSQGANAILAEGQYVSIHDNVIHGVDISPFTNCEGIYTKARWFDIHDNLLIDAGGNEAAINLKGAAWNAQTTLDASMNGLTLPQSTITVASTAGFPTAGVALVQSSATAGWEKITWTGKTTTTLTGVTGGTGTLSTGGIVRGEAHDAGSHLSPLGAPGQCHHNVIVFTRTDVEQKGIHTQVPYVEITDNHVYGATGNAISDFGIKTYGHNVERNVIRNHRGDTAMLITGSRCTVRNNSFYDHDGSYTPAATTYRAIYVRANGIAIKDVVISGNTVRNDLGNDGALTSASGKLRAVHLQAQNSGSVSDVAVVSNRGRNLVRSIFVSSGDPVSNVTHYDNDWVNEAGSAPVLDVANATTVMSRGLPIGVVSATLNFPSTAAASHQDLTITVTGAAVGDMVTLGVPNASVTAGIVYSAWVSAANTVTVRAHNYTAGALDPASGSFKVAVAR